MIFPAGAAPEVAAEVLAYLSYHPPADLEAATKIISGALDRPNLIPYA